MSNWWAKRLAEGVQASPKPASSPVRRPMTAVPAPMTPKDVLCPSCGGTNYAAAPGSERRRCFDCGWPIQQSGSGVGTTRSEGPAKKARQVPTAGYSPTQIIGRVE